MMKLRWEWKSFGQLSSDQLYTILTVRQEVFVLEQSCLYLDADGKDRKSFHLMGYDGDALVAYARIVEPGISYPEVSIGRILSSQKVRGKGSGKELMHKALERIAKEYGDVPVRISAQSYLKDFYQQFGFEPTGKEYLEDEIPHMEMLRKS
ncbi:MAG: GNAT family N-acetyltransferase [Flavobacteriales bacterium]|jgi:ElaA protein|nr:GNAT family N-acetyltransferase [Flavobacteriales bacterium]